MPLAPDFIVRSVSREPWKANRRPSKPCQDWLVELELCVQHLLSLHQVYKCVVPFKNKRSLAHALGDSLSKQRRWLRGKNSGTSMHPTSFPRRGTHGTGRYLRSPAGAGPWTKQNNSSKAGPVGTAGSWHSQESTSISSIESAHSSPRNKIEALKQIGSLALFGTMMPGLWFIKIPSWNTESNETDPLRCKNPPRSSDLPRKS